MTTTTLSNPTADADASPRSGWSRSRILALALFVPFTVYSSWVTVDQGYTGFLDVLLAGGWGTQVFLDLCIALLLVSSWIVRDARARRTPAWPWLLATVGLGSIAPLLYLVVRPGRAPAAKE